MNGIDFPIRLKKRELILGLIYIPAHMLLLPLLLTGLQLILSGHGLSVSGVTYNAVYFFIGFFAMFLILRSFLKDSFARFLALGLANLRELLLNLLLYYALAYAVSILATVLFGELESPNNDMVLELVALDLNAAVALSVLLAPFVEECLFRGVLFTWLAGKSRTLGYVFSAFAFAFLHVFQYLLIDFDPRLLLTMLSYFPAGIVLCRIYERTGTLWSSICLHTLINALTLYAVSLL